jgi:hypothetical protein
MLCKPLVNLIRHAYSRYKYVCANILALTSYFRQYYWRCDGLTLLAKICSASPIVVTMPIQKAVTSGNGNIEFYGETARSNLK